MVNVPRLAAPAVALALVSLIGLSACGGGDDPEPTPTVPAGVDLPDGVTLTALGSDVAVGQPATFIYDVGDGVESAVTATVSKIEQGTIEDFAFFTLDAESKASTPYYVTTSITNEGPAGIGSVAPPFVVQDDQFTTAPPNTINGTFEPCPDRVLPESFLPGETVEICLVFLLPKGRSIVSIDSVAQDPSDAIHWTP